MGVQSGAGRRRPVSRTRCNGIGHRGCAGTDTDASCPRGYLSPSSPRGRVLQRTHGAWVERPPCTTTSSPRQATLAVTLSIERETQSPRGSSDSHRAAAAGGRRVWRWLQANANEHAGGDAQSHDAQNQAPASTKVRPLARRGHRSMPGEAWGLNRRDHGWKPSVTYIPR